MQLREALDTALVFEHKIRDLYTESARKARDSKGQHVFATLAREEQGHVEHLQQLLDAFMKTGNVAVVELTSVLPPPAWIAVEAEKLAKQAKAAKGHPDAFKVELDLLKEALEVERQASAMYARLVADLAPEHQGVFGRFLEIENGHVSLVQAEIDALVGHGHWFDFMEFSLEQ